MNRILSVIILSLATLFGTTACVMVPATDTAPAHREIDIVKVRAAGAEVTDILTTAGEASLALSRWSDAEREDIKKSLTALKVANDELQKPINGPVDARALTAGVLRVADKMVPLLDLEPDARILVKIGISVLRGVMVMLPARPVMAS